MAFWEPDLCNLSPLLSVWVSKGPPGVLSEIEASLKVELEVSVSVLGTAMGGEFLMEAGELFLGLSPNLASAQAMSARVLGGRFRRPAAAKRPLGGSVQRERRS